ncbi:unnamed protein product [Adineta steineri]|uniref:Trafficking protein particle complex subunit 11 domain-containing protein n=2 Tax=Adineta steineri TaxID=433720 RepID=A0A819PIV1_9BILA|nr:unnamed protein product [Adineta steineri]CAF4015108.1 unnamed protein product [Adineta steineri]
MAWACIMPEELSIVPRGLVCLANLDTRHQSVHRSIWELLDKERANVPLRYRLVDIDEQYPTSKAKRATYEWYVPKGILKTSWMHKHLHLVPSLVVIFFELDWNDPLFKEKQTELKNNIDLVRTNLDGRGAAISVVLLQNKNSFPTVDDVYSSERDQMANTLCTYFDIPKRSLCVLPVLPQPDNLSAWIDRLEQTFIESSQNYYMNEIRRVKKHKETLNNITHQLLHIRHQFKVGFFSELKQDIPSAVKSYKNAYSYLIDNARIHDTNILEMKIIAGFLNYKICRISFELSQPVEAINHFRRHADIFKSKTGPVDLAFEHKAWLSKQFQTFADLFTRCPLAIQTQHPGFYYQESAYQSMARKQIAQTTCRRIEPTDFDPNEFLKSTEFYGQRPWRQHHQSMEISDAQKEREAIAALRDAESRVNHSELIISLLVQAITHFKKHSSNRMKLYLMYNLAEEYASSKDYDKALNYYNHIVQAYRTEQWWPILEAILPSALKCAYLSANLQDWIRFSLEILNPNIQLSSQIKNQTQTNLENLIIKNLAPQVEPTVSANDDKWKALLDKQPIVIDADTFKGLLECKVYFTHDAVSVDCDITLQVALKNGFPLSIEFDQLLVYFNLKEYDDLANVTDVEKLKFSPNEQRILTFNFTPRGDHVQRTLEITSVSLIYGKINQTHIDFQWRTSLQPNPSFQQGPLTPKWQIKAGHILWENLPIRRKTNVIMRAAEVQLTVEHQLPVLLYESYPIKIHIKNCENVDIQSAVLTCICSNTDENSSTSDDTFLFYATADSNSETTTNICSMTFKTINKDTEIEQELYIRCNNNRSREIIIRLSYERLNLHCMKEILIPLTVVNPFSIQFQTMGMMMEPLASLRAQEPFILMIDTKCISTIPITIVSTNLKPSQFIISECAIESQINNTQLKQDEVVTEGFCLRTQPIATPIVQNLLVGEYSLYWKRSSHPDIPKLCTTFSLSDFNVEQQQVYVEVSIPNHVPLQEPFQINYRIHNRSNIVHEYKINLEQINLIVAVCGGTMTSLLVPPHSSSDVNYTLVATLCGFVQLPKFKISMIRPPTQEIDESIDRTLPTHIFVVPSLKNS